MNEISFFFFKQKTAYEMRISDWSSDVCSSDLIAAGRVGAIFNAYTAKYTRELQRMAVEGTRLKIPLIFGYDVIHGHRTIFPISLGEAASWDLQALEKEARISAADASAEGLPWTFSSMVDIASARSEEPTY